MTERDELGIEYTAVVVDDFEFEGVAEPRGPRYSSDDKPAMNGILEMLSQRWTASIVCSLHEGINRFNAISRKHSVNPNTLKTRLRDLEAAGVVERHVESVMPPKVRYELTPKGIELAEIFGDLHQWVDKYEDELMATVAENTPSNQAAVFVSEEAKPYDATEE